MRTTSYLLLILIFSSLLACNTSHHSSDCQEADWYELGRRDGAMGKELRFEESDIPVLCAQSDVEKQKILFDIGRKAGLIDYCKPENAYELGKDGKSYTNVCPPETQTKFLEFFRKGHHVRELQEANQDIDKKVSILQEKIRELTPDNQKNLNTQISTLQNRKARNLRQVENIEKTIDL